MTGIRLAVPKKRTSWDTIMWNKITFFRASSKINLASDLFAAMIRRKERDLEEEIS